MKQRKVPMRTCIGCQQVRPKKELIRIVRKADGSIATDPSGKISGRGAYLCPSVSCLNAALKKRRIPIALNTEVKSEKLSELQKEFIKMTSGSN